MVLLFTARTWPEDGLACVGLAAALEVLLDGLVDFVVELAGVGFEWTDIELLLHYQKTIDKWVKVYIDIIH